MNHSNKVTCTAYSTTGAWRVLFSLRKRHFLEVSVTTDDRFGAYIVTSFSLTPAPMDYPRNAPFEDVLEYIERVLDRNAFL